ncbi:MAG: hypothetical protein HOK84_09195 [Bacteroidetes bacterium]|nr:hypothetical protein [Bacteroidota bacterium]
MLRSLFFLFISMGAFFSLASQTAFPVSIISDHPDSSDFPILSNEIMVNILVDDKDSKTVLLSAGLLADDIERVSGHKPSIVANRSEAKPYCIIMGSIENSRIIKKLIASRKIDVKEIKGEWESCLTEIVDNPLPDVKKALVIAGSDRRGTAYGVFELSKQIGVSPWYYFADMPPKKKNEIVVRDGRYVLKSPSVQYRGIFINDEMWGLRPWAMNTHAPDEGKGIGPSTYRKIFELLLRLKANILWPAMHQQTIPFNYYEENKLVADEYGIIMGSSHIEPMLRNNIGGAEWDTEYPGEPWDYVNNKEHIYTYWEDRIKANGKYENIYTIGKRGKDDEAGSDITVPVLEEIFTDQRSILKKWVNRDLTKVPQVLIPYTEVLGLYNQGLKVPDDVIICWPDDNFGNIRQLPNEKEQQRSGGSGIYYHFQWLNGATTAYPWTCTTPLGLTWYEMKKAYDFGADKLWIVNVGDIKPAEINIEYFMQMAWDIDIWNHQNSSEFLKQWADREFGIEYASSISDVMQRHYELGYARRPESMMMWNGRKQELKWDWFSLDNYDDEVQIRIDNYNSLIKEVDQIYCSLPDESKDAFFQMIVYNVKGTALQNIKILNAQKSVVYGEQKRASAASYATRAQQAEDEIYALIHHYNRELITVGDKWDHMASLPGPWGGQWHQWDMPPLSQYSGAGVPVMKIFPEGGIEDSLPGFSVYNNDRGFIDLSNTGNGSVYWSSWTSDDWIKLSEESGVIYDEKRIWVSIDWDKAPEGSGIEGKIWFNWSSAINDEWRDFDQLTDTEKDSGKRFELNISAFNPVSPNPEKIKGFVESNGCISIEAEHFSRKTRGKEAEWEIIQGLGRSGNSVTVLPSNVKRSNNTDEILTHSPCIEYDIYLFTTGEAGIQLNCSPGNPINADYGLTLAFTIDDGEPQLVKYKRGQKKLMDNLMFLRGEFNIQKSGEHTLKIWMVDPGIVIDKIIIDTGGIKESYLGPPESLFQRAVK